MKLEAIRAKIAKQPLGKAISPYEVGPPLVCRSPLSVRYGETTFDPIAIPSQSPIESAFEQRVCGLVRLESGAKRKLFSLSAEADFLSHLRTATSWPVS